MNELINQKRRTFLKSGTLVLATTLLGTERLLSADETKKLRIGLVTDLHYADKAPAGIRHYRETLSKLESAGRQFEQDQVDFIVELGDFIDSAGSIQQELEHLKTINRHFSPICKNRHYVLGNHCVDQLTKQEFLDCVEQEKTYYSFDQNGFHFVVLDGCFRNDGEAYQRKNFHWTDSNIPDTELEWLEGDLKANKKPVIVFVHQRLDINTNVGIKNNAAVRKILQSSGNILAVFQGHSHDNELREVGGIPYCTLSAMVHGSGPESNSYSVLEVETNGTIKLTGFKNQYSYGIKHKV